MSTETELAWAAGFFDGEGSAVLSPSAGGKLYARVSIGQNTREALDRFCAAVGVGKVYGPYTSNVPFKYQVNGVESVRGIADALGPFLCSVKREQFAAVIAYALSQPGRQLATHCHRGHDLEVVGRAPNRQCRRCKTERDTRSQRERRAKARAESRTVTF